MARSRQLVLGSAAVLTAMLLVATPVHASTTTTTTTSSPSTTLQLSPYDNAVLDDDPSVYWTLGAAASGGEADLGTAGITGTYSGSPSTTSLPNGDSATQFDGATQYFEAADADALSPTTTGEITIEAWIRPDALQFPNSESSGYVNWMGKGETGQYEYLGRMYSLTNTENRPNRISGYSFNTSGGLGAGSYFQDPVSTGEWIHYALVINTNNKGGAFPNGYTKVYKNGVLRDQDDLSIRGVTIVPERGDAPFRAGTRDFASWFEGAIGKIAVYDTELTPQQLSAHTAAMSVPASASIALSSQVTWIDRNGNAKADGSDRSEAVYTVSNIGSLAVSDIAVQSSQNAVTCTVTTLAPGQTVTCAPVVRKLTGGEVSSGKVTHHGIVSAVSRGGALNDDVTTVIDVPRHRHR
ncbi:LamG-like jellyroll fold domain-containing protein [Microbacterium sp.]|uniref:LamG-like jellyroll fold domain-containing protein n=1 Tax=Microbacterium sp. TaxID=51671 RepID=UPI00260838FB|nr:LamG-like jellyroll fold domain-containing protein [Microbacterium sp.]